MVNTRIFNTQKSKNLPQTDTVNVAGGTAYAMSAEHALCQYVVTGTFSDTYYVSATTQLEEIKKLVGKVSPELIAQAAVYGHQEGRMKDIPAYLLAVLAARKELNLLRRAWPKVITNPKMLFNFVQILRSGVTGRRSFGTVVKQLIQDWLVSRTGNKLFLASIGYSNPSLVDVIKMVHPRPTSEEQDALFGYLIDKPHEYESLPPLARTFIEFKRDNTRPLPDLDYRALTNCKLTPEHWKQVAQNMPWNTLRQNLNMLQRNGVFEDNKLTEVISEKIADKEEVRKWNAFPYQLLTTYQNTADIPRSVKLALQDALEAATENIPSLNTNVAVCIDLSGSMDSPVTGYRTAGRPTVTKCTDVAALVAAALARTNPNATVVAWASSVALVDFNPRDSVVTNAKKFSGINVGGGTNSALALSLLNSQNWKGNAVIYVSDNQSWLHGNRYGATGMAYEWSKFKRRNPNAKLACIDIQPYTNVQVKDDSDVLNIGGFSDTVFNVLDEFFNRDSADFVGIVNRVEL